jgi:iron-sulfur cluster assembly accessory protein
MAILELTEAAANKAKALLASSNQSNGALRVAVKNGGCSGMRYELLFDETHLEGDTELEFFGLAVWVDPESASFLENITIDFSDDLNDAGFKIQNPGANETCGCGESFSL